ncbi:hypothetical protein DB346_11355 [Verrucomicrobia bacterium LW23]|nr:hypothetical protein DB346_11355 [Verrucomicrobia bacterium LW23]
MCPDCRTRPGLRECVAFEAEDPSSVTMLSDDSSLTFYCRGCYTAWGLPYRVLRQFGGTGDMRDTPVAELPDFPAGTRCIYCDAAPAEVLSGADHMLICTGEPSYLTYTGRALCKPCHQWESTLFFARMAQTGIHGLHEVRTLKAEVVREMQCMRLLAPQERDARKAEANHLRDEHPESVSEALRVKAEAHTRLVREVTAATATGRVALPPTPDPRTAPADFPRDPSP